MPLIDQYWHLWIWKEFSLDFIIGDLDWFMFGYGKDLLDMERISL